MWECSSKTSRTIHFGSSKPSPGAVVLERFRFKDQFLLEDKVPSSWNFLLLPFFVTRKFQCSCFKNIPLNDSAPESGTTFAVRMQIQILNFTFS